MLIYPKRPQTTVGYLVDWGGALNGRRVAASEWSVHPAEPDGLGVTARVIGYTVTCATLSGGVAGRDYRVEGRATFADGGSATRGFHVAVGARG